jgi:tetratricopeptide (TPR) repeat protein
MSNKTAILTALFIVAALTLAWASMAVAQTTSSQDTLNQYVSDLQRNPSDTALREKIIRLAQEMNPPPAIPEEARRHYVKASTLLEDAKQPSDSADAAEEFRQALLAAPWWGEVYMKMGLALETAQRYDDAIAALKLFMATNPQDELLRKTQDEIYKIEAKAEKAVKDKELAAEQAARDRELAEAKARESSPEAVAAREFAALLRKIDGRRYETPARGGRLVIDVDGSVLLRKVWNSREGWHSYYPPASVEITGRETRLAWIWPPDPDTGNSGGYAIDYTISEDGSRITESYQCNDGKSDTHVYTWRGERTH